MLLRKALDAANDFSVNSVLQKNLLDATV